MTLQQQTNQVSSRTNYGKSFNVLTSSNVENYVDAFTNANLLQKANSKELKRLGVKSDVEGFFVMLSNIMQSITTRGMFTYEILEYIVTEARLILNKMSNQSDQRDFRKLFYSILRDSIVVFQKDYSTIELPRNISTAPQKELTAILYSTDSKKIQAKYGDKPKSPANKDRFDTNLFLNFSKTSGARPVVNKNVKNPTKLNPSLSTILLNDRNLRCGTKNNLELSAFFNLITTLEYAKSYPYLNATFILPSISKKNVNRVFKTATLNQFMFGSKTSGITDNYKLFEGNIKTEDGKIGVETNLSIFQTPQTAVNMDEKIGHRDQATEIEKQLRVTTVHDSTQPFMTLKDFTIDVAPTTGLMSFKTGKMSLVLHDRTRMGDIAPFIKPDLFGAFGAEIVVEYGWCHNEGNDTIAQGEYRNPIGAFMDSSRCIEKYMITNSQFTIENNGQVSINLSVAMKGPIDLRMTEISSDLEIDLDINVLESYISAYTEARNELSKNYSASLFNSEDSLKNSFRHARITSGNNYNKSETTIITKKIKRLEIVIDALKKANYTSGDPRINNIIINNIKNTRNLSLLIKRWTGLDSKNSPNSITIVSTKPGLLDEINDVRNALEDIKDLLKEYLARSEEIRKEKAKYIDSLLGVNKNKGSQLTLYKNDMFFDNFLKSKINPKPNTNKKDLKSFNSNNYVSLGTIINVLVGTHMSSTAKYDEIQLIFHTVNEYCGLASTYNEPVSSTKPANSLKGSGNPLNIASIPIKKANLEEFLKNIFEKNIRLTLESLISQIVVNFVMTKDNPAWGLDDLFSRKDANSPVKMNPGVKETTVSTRLNKIYFGNDTDLYEDSPKFIPPSIHLTFDTLTKGDMSFGDYTQTGQGSDYQRTICRINIYDRNDNPFQEHATLYNDFLLGKNTVKQIARLERKLERLEKSNAKGNNNTAIENTKINLAKKLMQLLKREVGGRKLLQDVTIGSKTYKILNPDISFKDIKEKYRSLIPTATFGTQNTSLINASVATINEGLLNTIYITRADRNKQSDINQNILVDIPLRVLPAQASVDMFGCPWLNFGQYVFLDFETGTTIDNTYLVTGFKHTFSPGKFTTQVSLSYGDVYGKYEGFAAGLSKAFGRFEDEGSLDKYGKRESTADRVEVEAAADQIEETSAPERNYDKALSLDDETGGPGSDRGDDDVYDNEEEAGKAANDPEGKKQQTQLLTNTGSSEIGEREKIEIKRLNMSAATPSLSDRRQETGMYDLYILNPDKKVKDLFKKEDISKINSDYEIYLDSFGKYKLTVKSVPSINNGNILLLRVKVKRGSLQRFRRIALDGNFNLRKDIKLYIERKAGTKAKVASSLPDGIKQIAQDSKKIARERKIESDNRKNIKKYAKYVQNYANQYRISQSLILAIMFQESKFKTRAVSDKKAQGLMQVMPKIAVGMVKKISNFHSGRPDLNDPETNIKFGIRILYDHIRGWKYWNNKLLAKKDGSISDKTLAKVMESYNLGELDYIILSYNRGGKNLRTILAEGYSPWWHSNDYEDDGKTPKIYKIKQRDGSYKEDKLIIEKKIKAYLKGIKARAQRYQVTGEPEGPPPS